MIDENLIDKLAEAVHQNYVREQLTDGVPMGSSSAMRDWADLDEEGRAASRAQARDIAAKIESLGGRVVTKQSRAPKFVFTDDEIEALARDEHARWSAERKAAGWRLGSARDNANKVHPSLKPWSKLSKVEKDKDRDAVRNIPAVLATVGLRLAR